MMRYISLISSFSTVSVILLWISLRFKSPVSPSVIAIRAYLLFASSSSSMVSLINAAILLIMGTLPS